MPQPKVFAGAGLVGAGFLLQLVGIFTPAWVSWNGGTQGLFQMCNDFGSCLSVDLSLQESKYKATVAMEILAFITSLAAVGITLVNFLNAMKGNATGSLHIASLAASIISGVFAIIGVIIFGAAYLEYISVNYSYFLTIFGAVMLMAGGVLTFHFRNRS